MNLYPRSFLKMIVLGNVLVTLPLLAAVGYASFTVIDLTRHSEAAARQSARTATVGNILGEQLTHMDRLLRQHQILHDASLLDDYALVRKEWQASLRDYQAIPMLAGLGNKVDAMRIAENSAYEKIDSRTNGLAELSATVIQLKQRLSALESEINVLLEQEHEDFRRQADALWWRLMAAVALAMGMSLLLLWLGRRTVATLWSRFERAVLYLGEGKLDRRIRLKGPEDLQRVGRRLEWLRKRMANLESERTRVMRHASHELKTPLAALREGASLLNDGLAGPLSPKQAKIAGIMQTNALRLQGLIDALLRLQQASHARDQMEVSAVRLDKLIEHTLATHRLAARNRQLNVSGSLAPLTVDGASEALATLANNLIANAIKFSPDGGKVRITLTSDGRNAVLDVIDDGPGIPPEDRERIFEPFYRSKAAKAIAGVGLGLAISREFALAHRGNLETIEAERGAHFRAVLPLTTTS